MKSDSEIERDVRDELKWDPDLNSDGVVTLAGFVPGSTDRVVGAWRHQG